MHGGADADAGASALVVLFCSLQPSIVYLEFELVHLDQHGAGANAGADAGTSALGWYLIYKIVYLVFELVHLDQHGANAMLVPMLVVLVLFCSLQTSQHQMCFLHTASVEYSVVDSDLENISEIAKSSFSKELNRQQIVSTKPPFLSSL